MNRRGVNPCLVCSEPAPGPKGGTVCAECRRKVAGYDDLRARSIEGTIAILLSTYPSVPGARRPFGADALSPEVAAEQCNARGRLELLLRELRTALDRPAAQWHSPLPGEGNVRDVQPRLVGDERSRWLAHDRNRERYNVPEALAQVLVDLDPFLHAALREAEEEGKRQGSNLLASLAAGDLTNHEFERRAGIARAKE